ncbi:hypothetical protein CK203_052568 [Vitis vinifera]|uniref:Uncharacterized protein n=1 Tax=Vitis vinifera TaxID=29760 RepID=A0A438GI85_VITVI|nr:hypothetical protein CK203_052568 [Vitis vinifera]
MMGCICCKPSAIEDSRESPRERLSSKASSNLRVAGAASSRREEAYRVKDRLDSNDGRTMLIEKQANGSVRLHGENVERKRERSEYVLPNIRDWGVSRKQWKENRLLPVGLLGYLQWLEKL